MGGTCFIIPARGGSKRLPDKNILPFYGMPMIAWTIKAAKQAYPKFPVYVSTDSRKIANVAEKYGAEFIARRSGFDDHTTVQQATIITLHQIAEERGSSYDTVIQLMACCPLRDADDIEAAYTAFCDTGARFQLSAAQYEYGNPWWAHTETGQALFPDALKTRSQDLDPLLFPVGAIWIAKVHDLYEAGTFYGPGYRLWPISYEHGFDIDTQRDLEWARALKHIEKGMSE
jgi:CMP-N-acetylneuraminic acid synthetase